MCGLAGIFSNPSYPIDPGVITAMGRAQQHRGPDNFSTFSCQGLALAHNRLSILDLSPSGNQPFTDDRYALAFNGEIYNYLELKRQLEPLRIAFTSTSDTEILFHYLIHFGIDRTLTALKGMFAFAFYDRATHKLVLARDRLGIKPLYWHRRDSVLYFGSEIKAIRAATPLDLDPIQCLFSVTGGAEAITAASMFKDVTPLKPGTYVTIEGGREPIETTYYRLQDQFDPAYADQLRRMPRRDINELFGDLLDRSVRSMLMSDAPMGIFVSGGIDSSLVAALAFRSQRLSLFTSDVQGPFSERADAEMLARTLNAPLNLTAFDPHAFLRDLAEATYHYECPIVSFTNAVAFLAVAKLARTHAVKAVLTGEGSDELFHGYPALLTKKFDAVIKLPLNVVTALYNVSPKLAKYVKVSRGSSQHEFVGSLVNGFAQQAERQAFDDQLRSAGYGASDYYTTIGMCQRHLVGLLHRNDRMGMAASIESRFPFLDEDIVKFGINLPAELKHRTTWKLHNYKHPFTVDKAPVRDVAARVLPATLANKTKWGFGVQAHETLRVKPGFFSAGFVGEICGLTRRGETHLLQTASKYYIGKLVSLEVFGRLYGHRGCMSEASDAMSRHVTVDSALPAPTSAPSHAVAASRQP